jgi:cytochrome c oxidase subunit II
MTDSIVVLDTLKLAYTAYALAIISIIAWLGVNLTREEKVESKIRIPFYGYMACLVFVGVSLHILTYNKIPWVAQDIKRHQIKVDKTVHIIAKDHKFTLPTQTIEIACGEKVMFDVDSQDLTYGFGLFRADHSMVFQIQANPHSRNDILWEFHKNGVYTIMSTEYSGPKGNDMIVKDAVKVSGCVKNEGDKQ